MFRAGRPTHHLPRPTDADAYFHTDRTGSIRCFTASVASAGAWEPYRRPRAWGPGRSTPGPRQSHSPAGEPIRQGCRYVPQHLSGSIHQRLRNLHLRRKNQPISSGGSLPATETTSPATAQTWAAGEPGRGCPYVLRQGVRLPSAGVFHRGSCREAWRRGRRSVVGPARSKLGGGVCPRRVSGRSRRGK